MTAALLLLGAFAANCAGAAATTEARQWYTGTTETGVTTLVPGTSQSVTTELREHPTIGVTATLGSTVGTGNTPVDITISGLSCSSCRILNEVKSAVSSSYVGRLLGKLNFVGVTVMEPPGCEVKERRIETNALSVDAHYMEGTRSLLRFLPESGAALGTITFEGCSIAGHYVLKTGSGLFAEAKNLTGVFKTEQGYVVSPSINSAAGGNLYLESTSHPAQWTFSFTVKSGGKFFGLR